MAYRCENRGGKLVYYKGNKLLSEGEVKKDPSIKNEVGQCTIVDNNKKKTKTKNHAEGYRCESTRHGLIYYDASGKIVPTKAVPTAARLLKCSAKKSVAKKTVVKETPAKKKGLYTKAKEKVKKGAKYVENKISPQKKKSPPKPVPVTIEHHTGKTNERQARQVVNLKSSMKRKETAKSRRKTTIEEDVKREYKHTGNTRKVAAVEEEIVKEKVKSKPKTQQVVKHTGKTNKAPAKPLPPAPKPKPKSKSKTRSLPPPPESMGAPPLPPPSSKQKSKTKSRKVSSEDVDM